MRATFGSVGCAPSLRLLVSYGFAAGLAALIAGSAVAQSAANVGSIIVKWREDIVPADATALPADQRVALAAALRAEPILVGRARNGALRFELTPPLSVDDARAAINRVRAGLPVLYARFAPPTERADVSAYAIATETETTAKSVDRLIVKYREPTLNRLSAQNGRLGSRQLDALARMAGQPIAHERAMARGAFVVRLFRRLPADQARALTNFLQTDPAIDYAEPDRRKYPRLVPNDPTYPLQWDFQTPATEVAGANLPPAWDITTGSTGVVVAVIDTGSLPLHPDLAGRYIGGYDMISDSRIANDGGGRDADPSDPGDWITKADIQTPGGFFQGCIKDDSSWHGTHVAGTIGAAANNGTGVAGINWVSRILPVRVLGKCGGFDSDIADGIVWAAGGSVPGVPDNPNPARVLNLSLGGDGDCGPVLQDAIDAALGLGAFIAIAAGNDNVDAATSSPANCDGVVTVAAIGRTGQKASYSNFGTTVEIAAPGGDDSNGIISTLNDGLTSPDPNGYDYVPYQGTSMATPHVAGIASLMLAARPTLTAAQVLAAMQSSARPFPAVGNTCSTSPVKCRCTTTLCGAGIVDAGAAVTAVAPPPTTTTLVSSSNPADVGSNLVITATVNGIAPTGTLTFGDGGITLQGCTNLSLVGGGNSPTAQCATSSLSIGTHAITGFYSGDSANRPSTSTVLSQSVVAPGEVNVALAANGGVATASGAYSSAYPATAINNNERAGANWGNGGGWNDATANAFPDWVQINFNGSKTIDRVVVYTVQDAFATPVEPTDTQTFSLYGVTDFTVQGWNGTKWIVLATVARNNLVKRTVSFASYTTTRVRINITNALASYSRITEVEAWGISASGPTAATPSLASSANPSVVGAAVTLTATIFGNAPTGSVNFIDGAVPMPGCSAVALAGTGDTKTAQCTTSALTVGTHSIVVAYGGDNANGASSSLALSQVVNNVNSSINVALASNGGVATASSTYSPLYAATAINNGERAGVNWGNGGGWNDGTGNAYPDWVQVVFNGTKTIDQVVIYTLQDNYGSPLEPTDTMTFSLYGVTRVNVLGKNGKGWATLGGYTNNNLVKRTVHFAPFTTDRIRINVIDAMASYSRITEVEVWGH